MPRVARETTHTIVHRRRVSCSVVAVMVIPTLLFGAPCWRHRAAEACMDSANGVDESGRVASRRDIPDDVIRACGYPIGTACRGTSACRSQCMVGGSAMSGERGQAG